MILPSSRLAGVVPIAFSPGDGETASTIAGVVDPRWSEWFGDFEATLAPSNAAPGRTTLPARLPDQSALPALLARVTGLNLKVVSVTRARRRRPEVKGPQRRDDRPIRTGGSNGQ